MDYTNLSRDELLSLLEEKDLKITEAKLQTPSTDVMVNLKTISEQTIDTEDDRAERSFDAVIDSTKSVYEDLRSDYLSDFKEALRIASSNNIDHDYWSLEDWFREGRNASISQESLLVHFLAASDKAQKDYLFNDYFKLNDNGTNEPSRYHIGISVNQNTLLHSIDKILEKSPSSLAQRVETLVYISDFVKENNYPNTQNYDESIKKTLAAQPMFLDISVSNGNHFGITSEEVNLNKIIADTNRQVDYICNRSNLQGLNEEALNGLVQDAIKPLNKLLSCGLWDDQIKNLKDDTFTASKNDTGLAANSINDVYNGLNNQKAKEVFREFLETKSLDLNTDIVFAQPTQRRSPKP